MRTIAALSTLAALLGLTACATPTEAGLTNDRFAMGSRAAVEATMEGERSVLCRRSYRTGTHIHGTVCLTVDEWRAVREESQTALQSIDQHMPQGNVPDQVSAPGAGSKF